MVCSGGEVADFDSGLSFETCSLLLEAFLSKMISSSLTSWSKSVVRGVTKPSSESVGSRDRLLQFLL